MFSYDSSQDGAVPVKFGKDRREKLVQHLKREHEQAFQDRQGLEKKWKLWLEQANSRRKRPDAKPRDAKIDMPFTRRRLMQNAARLLNPVFQQDQLMVARPSFPQYHDFAVALEGFMEYITGKVPLQEVCEVRAAYPDAVEEVDYATRPQIATHPVRGREEREDGRIACTQNLAHPSVKSY